MKLTQLISVLFLVIVFAGCGRSPQTTAEAYLKAMAAGNYADAKQYATIDASQSIDAMLAMGGAQALNAERKAISDFRFVDARVQGNSALVNFQFPSSGMAQSVKLVRVDGKWFVSELGMAHRGDEEIKGIASMAAKTPAPPSGSSEHRALAIKVLEELRILESAIGQCQTEHDLKAGAKLTGADLAAYMKRGSALFERLSDPSGAKDPLGNPYGAFEVGKEPQVNPETAQTLSDVAPADYWGQFISR